MKRCASIDQILRPLKEMPFQAYLSNAVQVADILEWILSQVGVAEVWQTSFSISEEFLRRLFFITKDKRVSRINLVLDHMATNKTLKLWAFITQVIERTYLADNHSKILLVKSEAGDTVSVITSQNLTRGNRHESAFISTSRRFLQISTHKSTTLSQIIQYRSMTYSETELTQIEKYASIYLKISDIAVILDIPADVLRADIADRGTDVSKAYRRGKAASKVKLHSQEMMLAQVGSPLAIENAHRNLLDMEDDE